MSQQTRQSRRRLAGVSIALIAALPVIARAEVALPQLDPELCDGPEEPDLALPALSDLDAELPRLREGFDLAFNASVIDSILKSTGDVTRLASAPAKPRTVGAQDVFIVKIPASPPKSALANPTFGDRDGMAVSISPRLVSSGALNTDIKFNHSSDMVDAGLDLATQQSLVTADPMAMRYDGRALVKFGPTLQLGVAAHGTLGTVAAPTLSGSETAGPLFHINLIDQNVSLVSDLGYDFGLNPLSAASRTQFHAKLDLKLKL